jgi:Flp pilus assembly pilin Flp
MKHSRKQLKNQGGFTAVEFGLIIIGVAVLTVIAIIALRPYLTGGTVSGYETQINHFISGADRWKAGKPSYAGLSCSTLLSKGYIEGQTSSCSTLSNDGGSVTIAAANSNRSVRVVVDTTDDKVATQVADFYNSLGNAYTASASGTSVTVTK